MNWTKICVNTCAVCAALMMGYLALSTLWIGIIKWESEKMRIRMASAPPVPPTPKEITRIVEAMIAVESKAASGKLRPDDPSIAAVHNLLSAESEDHRFGALMSFGLSESTFTVFTKALEGVTSHDLRARLLCKAATRTKKLSPTQKMELFDLIFDSLRENQPDPSSTILQTKTLLRLDPKWATHRLSGAILDGTFRDKRMIHFILREILAADAKAYAKIVAEAKVQRPDLSDVFPTPRSSASR